jgi:hypothetical protein
VNNNLADSVHLKAKMVSNERRDSEENVEDYYLDRLFDEEQLYFTPMEELLKRYKKIDFMFVNSKN